MQILHRHAPLAQTSIGNRTFHLLILNSMIVSNDSLTFYYWMLTATNTFFLARSTSHGLMKLGDVGGRPYSSRRSLFAENLS
jgi:hypothetical protein